METAAREPALSRKTRIIGKPVDMGGRKSKKRHGRIIRRSKKLQPIMKAEETSSFCSADSDTECKNVAEEEDEKVDVENKVIALQKIVPRGESVDNVDELFEETAGYILELQNQIQALKFLARFFEGSQKDFRKFGG